MLGKLARTVFGSANDRFVKKQYKIVQRINALEPEISPLSDEELKAKTEEFKQRLKNGETLDDLLPEAFAVVREAAKRTLGQRHYDVQLIGGIVLHKGMIAEMKTGEGKTLVVHACRLSERAGRQRRPHRYRQRLSGQTRRRMDGAGLPLPRADGRLYRPRKERRRAPRRL